MKNAVSTGISAASEKLIRILAFTMTLSSMGATLFNIVLPDIKEEFGLSVAQVSWVTTIYGLIYAIGSVIYGKLADAFPLKKLLTFGFILFCLGSLIGLSAQAYWMVLLRPHAAIRWSLCRTSCSDDYTGAVFPCGTPRIRARNYRYRTCHRRRAWACCICTASECS